jgi:hypothetical protein
MEERKMSKDIVSGAPRARKKLISRIGAAPDQRRER